MSWHQRIARAGFWTVVAGLILVAPNVLGEVLGNWLIAEFL